MSGSMYTDCPCADAPGPGRDVSPTPPHPFALLRRSQAPPSAGAFDRPPPWCQTSGCCRGIRGPRLVVLWPLLKSCAGQRPRTEETLAAQALAADSAVWLALVAQAGARSQGPGR